jgi:glycosyltransferase involved in cell wall biosynthesis
MKDTPLVSVLMNCFNGEAYLQEAINSVISQTYENWELIFWDNQSTDKSSEIFLKNKDPRLHYYYSPTHTILGAARNAAINKVKGDWIAIIDTDDVWYPDKLVKQISAVLNTGAIQNSVGLVYSRVMGIDKNNIITQEVCHKDYSGVSMPEGRILYDLLFKGNFIMSPSILINTKVFSSVGGFPEDYMNAPDYYISCAISSKSDVICVDKFLTQYRIHDNNLTMKQKVISYEEQIKIFIMWSECVNCSLIEKTIKIKQLNTFAGLMMIKYNKNIIKGFLRILTKGSLLFGIKSIILELIKLKNNQSF